MGTWPNLFDPSQTPFIMQAVIHNVPACQAVLSLEPGNEADKTTIATGQTTATTAATPTNGQTTATTAATTTNGQTTATTAATTTNGQTTRNKNNKNRTDNSGNNNSKGLTTINR